MTESEINMPVVIENLEVKCEGFCKSQENEQLKKDNEELNAKLIELNTQLNGMQETANMLLRACKTARVADKLIAAIALEEAIAQATNTKSPLAIIPREEYENLLKEKK